jgi:glycogen debranching enzyme
MPDPLPPFVLKNEETFAILDSRGEICPDLQNDAGIFHRGARHVSRLQVLLWERPPVVLSSTERGAVGVHVSHLSNNDGGAGGPGAMTVHLERSTVLTATACLQRFCFTSYGDRPVVMPLTLLLDADFRDIFEVRGYQRPERGRTIRRHVAGAMEHVYRGLDGEDRVTVLRLSEPVGNEGEEHLGLLMTLEPRQTRQLFLVLDFHPAAQALSAEEHYNVAMAATIQRFRDARRSAATVITDNPAFNSWLMRSFSDVHLLASQVEDGLYPYAGVPWFSCPFGRDGLITARQMLMVEPRLARGVLGYLAHRQAGVSDPAHDEEPGKILHESRLGEMAALGEVPFGSYYGAVDATPLFLMLAGDYLRRSDDRDFIAGLLPALQSAMAWIHRAEAASEDGFLRYLRTAEGGLRNRAGRTPTIPSTTPTVAWPKVRSPSAKCRPTPTAPAGRSPRSCSAWAGRIRPKPCGRRPPPGRSVFRRPSGSRRSTPMPWLSMATADPARCGPPMPVTASGPASPRPRRPRPWPGG